MIEKLIFLIFILILGLLSKQQTIIIAVLAIIGFVVLRLNDTSLEYIKGASIKYGIILITIYAFIPIAKGDITHHDLIEALVNWRAWIAIFSGILVTQFAKHGIELMKTDPDLVTFILIGIIMGLVVFKGKSSGPLIGSGIAVMFYSIINQIVSIFK